MRISDWSSDVCSSDLLQRSPPGCIAVHELLAGLVLLDGACLSHYSFLPSPLGQKRHVEALEQGACFLVRLRGGADDDVHPADSIDGVVFDLRDHDLLLTAHGIVAEAIEAFANHPAEVAHTRIPDPHQALPD